MPVSLASSVKPLARARTPRAWPIALFCVVFHNFFQDSLERINDQLKILLIRAASGAREQSEVPQRVSTPLHTRTA